MSKRALIFALMICGLFATCPLNNDEQEVKRIVQEAMVNSLNYVPRTSNRDFLVGATDNVTHDYGLFDFIVIGAGAAGAIIAKRLAEAKFVTLLIEAGDEELPAAAIPALWAVNQNSRMNWGYYTTPQTNYCQGMIGKRCNYPRGMSLGGSTAINNMAYVRGSEVDYDLWYKMGSAGWSFDDVLPYFKKLENYQMTGNREYHGYAGPVNVFWSQPLISVIEHFVDANVDMGLCKGDYNGPPKFSTGRMHYTMRNGRRDSTAQAYLSSFEPKYLNITTRAYAYKVRVNALNFATSVDFARAGIRYNARAAREIIVSAGSINSPQLLQLSGIGPKADLQRLGIPVVQDLPVGRFLQDHVAYTDFRFQTTDTIEYKTLDENVKDFINGVGVLTHQDLDAIAFINTKPSIYENYPDVELFLAPYLRSTATVFNADEDFQDSHTFSEAELEHIFAITLILLHPKSVGTVKLASKDPFEFPLIDPNGYAEPVDLETMYNATQYVLKLLETETYKRAGVTLIDTTLEACKTFEYLSKDYFYCQLRHTSSTLYHPVSTCRMGPINDPTTVVNNRLRVHNVRRLRVADASVIPIATSGHTAAPAMMIGERAAAMILEDNPRPLQPFNVNL